MFLLYYKKYIVLTLTFVLETAKLDNIETSQEDPVKGVHQVNGSMVEAKREVLEKGLLPQACLL